MGIRGICRYQWEEVAEKVEDTQPVVEVTGIFERNLREILLEAAFCCVRNPKFTV